MANAAATLSYNDEVSLALNAIDNDIQIDIDMIDNDIVAMTSARCWSWSGHCLRRLSMTVINDDVTSCSSGLEDDVLMMMMGSSSSCGLSRLSHCGRAPPGPG